MDTKWSKNGIKMDPKSNPKLMKRLVNIFMLYGRFCQVSKRFSKRFQAAAAKAAAETAVAAMTAAWFSNGLKHKFQTGCRIDRSFRPRANPGSNTPLGLFFLTVFSVFLSLFLGAFWKHFRSIFGVSWDPPGLTFPVIFLNKKCIVFFLDFRWDF